MKHQGLSIHQRFYKAEKDDRDYKYKACKTFQQSSNKQEVKATTRKIKQEKKLLKTRIVENIWNKKTQ